MNISLRLTSDTPYFSASGLRLSPNRSSLAIAVLIIVKSSDFSFPSFTLESLISQLAEGALCALSCILGEF